MKNRSRALGLMTCLVLGALAACSPKLLEPRPDPSRFFTLTPIEDAGTDAAALKGRVLGVGPITLPHYLERPEIVTRVAVNEVRKASFDYWAGSLQKQFGSTLAQNLQTLLAPSSIVNFPWFPGNPPDLAIEVDVIQFERGPDAEAHLVARWRLRKGAQVVRSQESKLARAATEDPASTVAALSELLAQLSREIAAAATT